MMKRSRIAQLLGVAVCAGAFWGLDAPNSAHAQQPDMEFRINTGMPGFGVGEIIDTAPGVVYLFDSDVLIINLDIGAGAVIGGDFVLGVNAGVIINENTDSNFTAYNLRAGPYFRFAPGISHRSSSFFAEAYAAGGILHVDGAGDDQFTFNGGFWAGWQAFLGDDAALTFGPFVEYVNIDGNDDGLIGGRIGLSVFP